MTARSTKTKRSDTGIDEINESKKVPPSGRASSIANARLVTDSGCSSTKWFSRSNGSDHSEGTCRKPSMTALISADGRLVDSEPPFTT